MGKAGGGDGLHERQCGSNFDIKQFIEHTLCARLCAESWGYKEDKGTALSCPRQLRNS